MLLLLAGCSTLSPFEKSTSQKPLPQYWLKSSLFAGRFYDDNQVVLIDCRPFSAIGDMLGLENSKLYPPDPNHIIPAGTLVEITAITYPTTKEKLKRPLYSPKDSIWVYFRVAKERGKVTIFREKTHVMIIPQTIQTEENLKIYFKNYLSLNDPNVWILKEPSYIRQAIWNKKPVIGMTKMQVEASLGPPLKKQFMKEHDEKEPQELWHYDEYFITIKGNRINKIKNINNKST